MSELIIEVGADGSLELIADAAMLDAMGGSAVKRRVSHVEPCNQILRWVFHSIRRLVEDESRAAEFTRRWPCLWRARMFHGPTLGPFADRAAAIAAEVEWISTKPFSEVY